MAPLPEESTKRYWGVYTVAEDEHRVLMRVANTVTDAQAVAEMEDFFLQLQPSLGTDVVFTGMEVAALGSNVRNPVAITGPITGTAAGSIAGVQEPRSWTIKGRSVDGRRVGVTIFGVFANTPTSWEEEPIVVAGLADARDVLNAPGNFWLSISGLKPVWYNRVTVNYNDHWVKQERG